MNGPNAPADGLGGPAQTDSLLPVPGADEEMVAPFGGVADIQVTDPASHRLVSGVRLASVARLKQFTRAGSGDCPSSGARFEFWVVGGV